MTTTEQQIELDLIAKLGDLKYTYRPIFAIEPRSKPTSGPNSRRLTACT
ncbi:hypothetical protein BANRA_00452 [Escherichia coli]|nr:hypothetical protein BANRA_00452 [Escherichia coli]